MSNLGNRRWWALGALTLAVLAVGPGGRDLPGAGAWPDPGRLAAAEVLGGLGVSAERPGRPGGAGRRLRTRAGVPRGAAPQVGPGRGGRLDRRPGWPDLWSDRGGPQWLGHCQRPGSDDRGPGVAGEFLSRGTPANDSVSWPATTRAPRV